MKLVKIEAYEYHELSEAGKYNARLWLDECPIDYEDEHGSTYNEYPSEWDEDTITEHCKWNDYIFNIYGKPIHNLIIEG
jgi:hypothetical protein